MSEDTKEWLAGEVLRLGNEVRDRSKERDALKEHIKYLEIELKCETGRWERAMEDNARLKAEVDALKLGSLLTAVDVLQFINLKAENERLRKAGDAIAICLCGGTTEEYNKQCALNWLAAKEGKQP